MTPKRWDLAEVKTTMMLRGSRSKAMAYTAQPTIKIILGNLHHYRAVTYTIMFILMNKMQVQIA